MKITHKRLQDLLSYDEHTGSFTWRQKPSPRANRVTVGMEAGARTPSGYVLISIDGERFGAHRLAVFYATGRLPSGEVDHLDGDPSNNRLANLREVSHQQNMQNERSARKQNACGFAGVSLCKRTGRYRADISIDGKSRLLGRFMTPQEAHARYVEEKRATHEGSTL